MVYSISSVSIACITAPFTVCLTAYQLVTVPGTCSVMGNLRMTSSKELLPNHSLKRRFEMNQRVRVATILLCRRGNFLHKIPLISQPFPHLLFRYLRFPMPEQHENSPSIHIFTERSPATILLLPKDCTPLNQLH